MKFLKILSFFFLFTSLFVTLNIEARTIDVTEAPYYADPTYANDSTLAFQTWFNDVVSQHAQGYIPAGHYKLANAQMLWDFKANAATGTIISGDGMINTLLDFTGNLNCPALQIENSTGTGSGSGQAGLYYSSFHDLGFEFNSSCVGMALGQNNLFDCPNSFNFTNVWWGNANSGKSNESVTVQINCMVSSTFQNIVINNNPGYGDALQIIHGDFNTFNGSFSNAHTAIHITQNESYDNIFINSSVGSVLYGIISDSPQAKRNKFIGGEWDINLPGGYAVSATTGYVPYGGTVILEDINFPSTPPYTGSFLDPNNHYGVLLKGTYPNNVIGIPTTCASKVYTNSYGQTMWAFIWGGSVSTIYVDNVAYSVSSGMFILHPDSTISFRCGSPPLMYWTAM